MNDYPTLLPPNASAFERAIEHATARIGDIPVPLRMIWNPATCPESLLPWLAWSLSVDAWASDWPVHIKRAHIAHAIKVQREKGTAQSVKDVIAGFGGRVEIVEWWQKDPPGAPHTFELVMAISAQTQRVSAQIIDDVIAAVTAVKPVRSHFTFTQGASSAGTVGLAAAARVGVFVRLQLGAQ